MMTRKEAAKLGGQKMAPKIRKKALDKYYSDPNYCKECGKRIEVRENERPSFAKKRTFCNHSCAAKYNLRNREYKPRVTECERCGKNVTLKKGAVYKRKYCDTCLPVVVGEKTSNRFPNARVRKRDIPNLTKDELLKLAGNPYKFKLYVTWHAKKVYSKAYPNRSRCLLCEFEHMQVCHIKDVANFDGNILIRVINSLSNLIGLCPNHHWALDNHKLRVDEAEVVEAHGCSP
jgi:hypothetical protein